MAHTIPIMIAIIALFTEVAVITIIITYTPSGLTTNAYFWTSSSGKSRQINYSETGIKLAINVALTNAYSVRCIKDY
jgi:hypothetical protein